MALVSASDDEISLTSTVLSEQQSEYEVETILAEHEWPNGTRYLVQWAGYPIERSTWEPADSFSFNQTILDWEERKREIAEGKQSAFDVAALEERVRQLGKDKKERKRRRAAKRRKIALSESSYSAKSLTGRNASEHDASNAPGAHPLGSISKSASFDQVRPSTQGVVSSSARKQPPVLFANSQSAPVRAKKASSTDTPKLFNNLSTKWKYEKTKNMEPAPNIRQLDLRRPSEWDSMSSVNATQLGSSRLASARTDAAENRSTGKNGPSSVLDTSSPLHPFQMSPVASPMSNDSVRNGLRPERDDVFNMSRGNLVNQGDVRIPSREYNPEIPPRRPKPNARHFSMFPGRFVGRGELFVSMFFGPEKQAIGHARLCGFDSLSWNVMYRTKSHHKVIVWFQHLCTLDEYNALCGHMVNRKYGNGWVEGFDDTEPNILKAAEILKQKNLVAIAHLDNDRKDVLLAYPPRSPDFEFLDDSAQRGQGYLNLTLRSSLGPIDRLNSSAKNSHPHVTKVNNTAKIGHSQPEVNGPSGTKPLANFNVAQENVTHIITASPRLDILNKAVTTPSSIEGNSGVRNSAHTSNSVAQGAGSLSGSETMDLDDTTHAPQALATTIAGAGPDAVIDLEDVFRKNFEITFEKIATVGGTVQAQRAEMFYLWFPDGSEAVKNERDLMTAFLKKHTRLVYSSRVEEDWERFVAACNTMQGAILFHDSFVEYHNIPFFRELLRRATGFWNVSLSQQLKYADRPLHLQRLFPHGAVILLTEDFMVRESDATLIAMEWFYEWTKKKFPGSSKMMVRPDILNWLLKKVESDDKSKQPKWLAMYHLLRQLGIYSADDIHSNFEDDYTKGLVISPHTLPMYGSRTADDSPDVPSDFNQDYRDTDHLAEFFAGWSLVNAHRFRRFTMVTALKPLERWTNWQHLEVRYGAKDFMTSYSIGYKAIWKKLMNGVSKSTSGAENVPYTPRTPGAPITSTSTSEKRSASSASQPTLKHKYAQPYQ